MLASQTIKLRHSVTFTLTPSHLDIVLFLMDIFTFSFVLITFMRFLSRTIVGYERFRIWVGMVDDWWWSKYSNLIIHSIKHKSSGSKTVKERIEKPDEVHVWLYPFTLLQISLGRREWVTAWWDLAELCSHKTRLNSLNCHGSTYVWIYSI